LKTSELPLAIANEVNINFCLIDGVNSTGGIVTNWIGVIYLFHPVIEQIAVVCKSGNLHIVFKVRRRN